MTTKQRLIDANKLLELYYMGEELEGYASVLSVPIPVIRQNIKDMPTVDAVEVVRCGICRYRRTRHTCAGRPMDFFCADGER